ncbi:DinB family protein [Streptomyces fuscichromogenes]|uniref:DinB-like domain-containing protein n=1 Tax=Streptomyces fuscichromogenes TaxID=1324013 RepID=A0A918CTN1_9ACTN|nr:hypothetical protein [Streptomyces fuscichromogenes]GGN22202.1 hypothetical protein GCM10011578_053840 [Streptomyces fuscichromogenes]
MHEIEALLREYDRARAYTDDLWMDLIPDEVSWRPHENSSAIGWHLGRQAHVAHFVIRNLTAAGPSPDPELDGLMDSANPEKFRGALPSVRRLTDFRTTVAERVHARTGDIAAGRVGAPRTTQHRRNSLAHDAHQPRVPAREPACPVDQRGARQRSRARTAAGSRLRTCPAHRRLHRRRHPAARAPVSSSRPPAPRSSP